MNGVKKQLQAIKNFAIRGNLIDLAVGFTVGAAFTTVAKSLVTDIIMPPVGWLIGRSDFADLFWVLRKGTEAVPPYATLADAQAAGAVTVNYGIFINNVIAFFVVTIVMFALIKVVTNVDSALEDEFGEQAKEADKPSVKKCPYCLSTIPFRATRCSHCTSKLEQGKAVPQSA